MTNKPDFDETLRFLTALDPDATGFTFQTFDDDAERKAVSLARIVHGSLKQRWPELRQLMSEAQAYSSR
jgi:hypothetical protein